MYKPPPIQQEKRFRSAARASSRLCRLLANIDLPWNLKNLSPDRPTLLAGNHRSLLDLFVCLATFDQVGVSGHILIQAKYFGHPVMGPMLRGIGCIPIARGNHLEAEAAAVARLGEGKLVAIMPEGRLTPPEDWVDGVGPGRPGAARIASAAGAQCIAIGFAGTETVWPRGGRPRLPRGHRPNVVLRDSDPFDLRGSDPVEQTDQIMSVIRRTVAEAQAVQAS